MGTLKGNSTCLIGSQFVNQNLKGVWALDPLDRWIKPCLAQMVVENWQWFWRGLWRKIILANYGGSRNGWDLHGLSYKRALNMWKGIMAVKEIFLKERQSCCRKWFVKDVFFFFFFPKRRNREVWEKVREKGIMGVERSLQATVFLVQGSEVEEWGNLWHLPSPSSPKTGPNTKR